MYARSSSRLRHVHICIGLSTSSLSTGEARYDAVETVKLTLTIAVPSQSVGSQYATLDNRRTAFVTHIVIAELTRSFHAVVLDLL